MSRIIHQCSFDGSLAYLAYRRSGEMDWTCARCLGWFPYKIQASEVLDVPERHFVGKKINQEGALRLETILQIDVFYGSSKRIKGLH